MTPPSSASSLRRAAWATRHGPVSSAVSSLPRLLTPASSAGGAARAGERRGPTTSAASSLRRLLTPARSAGR
uniref:Uncharacterized protein n=1 Tax=Triticum urartu TaxID=4572 RepID=A0A8R7TLY8_TRIUA